MKFQRVTIGYGPYGREADILKAEIEVKGHSYNKENSMKFEIPEEVALEILKVAMPYIVGTINGGMADMLKDGEAILLGKPVEGEVE